MPAHRLSSMSGRARALGTSALAFAWLWPCVANAQTADQRSVDGAGAPVAESEATSDDPSGSEGIVVTGSRIARRDYSSASPIVTVERELFDRSGAIGVDTLVQSLPQLGSTVQSGTGNNTASGGTSQVNLHYLGANRTLLLIDGRRTVAGAADGSGDLNVVPLSLLQSVEIITGGASAVYGSDAIGGVVNFKLNDRLEGARLSAVSGVSERGDAFSANIDGAFGWQDPDNRGGIVAYAAYAHRGDAPALNRPRLATDVTISGASGVLTVSPRVDNNLIEGTYVPAAANLPTQASVDAVFAAYGVGAGTVARSGALGFNSDGTLFANAPLVNYRGGQVANPYYLASNAYTTLQVPSDRYSAGVLAHWRLSDVVEVYNSTYYLNSKVLRSINPVTFAATIPLSNPFVPAALRTILAARPNPTAGFTINRTLLELGDRTDQYSSELIQTVFGVRGRLGGDWRYDLYGSYGRNVRDELATGAYKVAAVTQLLTAADGGQSLCAGGFNLFGANRISQSCIDYISYSPRTHTDTRQTVVEGTVNGSLFNLPAGAVKVALGAVYRREQYDVIGDPLFQSGAVVGGLRTSSSISGRYDVKEAYGEILVPIFADRPFANRLEVSAGYRRSDYSLAGGTDSYKAEAIYAPVEQLSFRGSYQRAVRAPAISELFLPQALSNLAFTQDPCSFNSTFRAGTVPGVTGASVRTLCLAQGIPAALIDSFVGISGTSNIISNRGNPALTPEVADTFTVGGVLKSPFSSALLRNFSLSVDYYKFKIANTIALPSFNDLLIRCYNQFGTNPGYDQDSVFCDGLTRSGTTGQITGGLVTYRNVGRFNLSGIDTQFDWRIPLDDNARSGAGEISVRFAGSYLVSAKRQTLAGAPFDDVRGTYGTVTNAFPKWKHSLWLQYAVGPFDIGGRWRYIDQLRSSNTITAPTVPALDSPAYNLFDLDMGVQVDERFGFRLGIENLTDKQPPYLNPNTGNNTDSSTYDVLGRRFYARVTTRF